MPETTLTITLDYELKEKFSHIARANNTSESDLVRHLMRDHVRKNFPRPNFMPPENCSDEEYAAWLREQAQIGLDEANAGMLVAHEEVEAEARKWRMELKRKLTLQE